MSLRVLEWHSGCETCGGVRKKLAGVSDSAHGMGAISQMAFGCTTGIRESKAEQPFEVSTVVLIFAEILPVIRADLYI